MVINGTELSIAKLVNLTLWQKNRNGCLFVNVVGFYCLQYEFKEQMIDNQTCKEIADNSERPATKWLWC